MGMSPTPRLHLVLAVWLGLVAHLSAGEAVVGRTTDGGQQVDRDGLMLLSLVGDPAVMGRQAGDLLAPKTQMMLTSLSLKPGTAEMMRAVTANGLENSIPQEYRDEIAALAVAAKCDPSVLLRANLAVDVLCTAVVRQPDAAKNRPLLLGRNMDFGPVDLLGRNTVVMIRRPTGHHASVAISWPGYVGIVSGMNDAGISACLLLNHAAKRADAGDSLGFRLRAILDRAASLDEAVALFAASPTRASNYVMLADGVAAAVVWWDDGKLQRIDPADGWLLCTNARIDAESHRPTDARGKHALELTRVRPNPDVDWMKHLLSATYMRGINAQAMVFVPQTRVVHLAVFAGRPAALSPWHELDGAALMSGADLGTVSLATSAALSDPFEHYAGGP
jgi:hypothetical protein